MPRSIESYLNEIANARYGEEVRTAIHDSIQMCYSDVTASQTTAASAASTALAQADRASTQADRASTQADRASTQADRASTQADRASTAADNADTATQSATNATTLATQAARNADSARTNLLDLTNRAEQATNSANAATANANTATGNATAAANDARQAKDSADQATTTANTAAARCDSSRISADAATTNTNTAISRANQASALIENLSVGAITSSPGGNASASVGILNGHYDISFTIPRGEMGPGFIVKGAAYETLQDLMSAVTNPAEGDQYNVGSEAPYSIYRWTGNTWEDQGEIGVNIDSLTSAEIKNILNNTPSGQLDDKYLNGTGLSTYNTGINKTINTKVDKVDGKGLSTNDFTTAYKNKIDANETAIANHTTQISSLNSDKVDKVSGKGLSTNDFTNAYKNKINANETAIAANKPSSFTVTLTAADWLDNTQNAASTQFVASGYIYLVSPASASHNEYGECGIYADEVSVTGSMTFHCGDTPINDLTVNIVRMVSA